jgi:hypothetical protein
VRDPSTIRCCLEPEQASKFLRNLDAQRTYLERCLTHALASGFTPTHPLVMRLRAAAEAQRALCEAVASDLRKGEHIAWWRRAKWWGTLP